MKKCRYCQSKIDTNAVVCPICKRDQRLGNNPLWLIPIITIIVISLYFIFSPNAPFKVRETVCGLGIRSGCPYCCYYPWEK